MSPDDFRVSVVLSGRKNPHDPDTTPLERGLVRLMVNGISRQQHLDSVENGDFGALEDIKGLNLTYPSPHRNKIFSAIIAERRRNVNLEEFLRKGDRTPPAGSPFFAGRTEQLTSFAHALTETTEYGGVDETLVCQGAPGAGKTAIAKECAALAARRSNDHVVVQVTPGVFDSARDFVRIIDEAVSQGSVLGRIKKIAGVGLGIHADGNDEPTVQRLFDDWQKAWAGKTIAVLVDEAQNIENSTAARRIVQMIHAGPIKSRILLACFGLSDTEQKLDQLGIPRLSDNRMHNLGSLSPEAVALSVGLAFDSFEVRGPDSQRAKWTAEIVRASHGWPQHLTILVKAALSELHAHDMDFQGASLRSAMRVGNERKLVYYAKRLEKVGHSLAACQAVVARLKEKPHLSSHEIEKAAGSCLPAGEAPLQGFLTEAIHAGVLSRVGPDHYSVPIPSFARYIREGGAPVLQEESDSMPSPMDL